MNSLKPCPFCGGEAVLKELHHVPNGYDYTPTCLNPSCAGRITKKWINKEDAIKAWNRRTEPERKKGEWLYKPNEYDDDTYECSQCGEPWTLIEGTPKENNMNFCPNCGAEMRGDR